MTGKTDPLGDQLDALRSQFQAGVSTDVRDKLARGIRDLVGLGQAIRALRAGDPAPMFALDDSDGVVQHLSRLLARGPLAVIFFRGIWCPHCIAELDGINAIVAEVHALGASLVAVSEQTRKQNRRLKKTHNLNFSVLRDPGGELTAAFGLRWTLPPWVVEAQRDLGVDLARYQGKDGEATVPIPARFVIGRDGIISYADVDPDYTRHADPRELLAPLRMLRDADQRPCRASTS